MFKVVFLRKAKIFLAIEEATGLVESGGAAGRGGAACVFAAVGNGGATGRGGAPCVASTGAAKSESMS